MVLLFTPLLSPSLARRRSCLLLGLFLALASLGCNSLVDVGAIEVVRDTTSAEDFDLAETTNGEDSSDDLGVDGVEETEEVADTPTDTGPTCPTSAFTAQLKAWKVQEGESPTLALSMSAGATAIGDWEASFVGAPVNVLADVNVAASTVTLSLSEPVPYDTWPAATEFDVVLARRSDPACHGAMRINYSVSNVLADVSPTDFPDRVTAAAWSDTTESFYLFEGNIPRVTQLHLPADGNIELLSALNLSLAANLDPTDFTVSDKFVFVLDLGDPARDVLRRYPLPGASGAIGQADIFVSAASKTSAAWIDGWMFSGANPGDMFAWKDSSTAASSFSFPNTWSLSADASAIAFGKEDTTTHEHTVWRMFLGDSSFDFVGHSCPANDLGGVAVSGDRVVWVEGTDATGYALHKATIDISGQECRFRSNVALPTTGTNPKVIGADGGRALVSADATGSTLTFELHDLSESAPSSQIGEALNVSMPFGASRIVASPNYALVVPEGEGTPVLIAL